MLWRMVGVMLIMNASFKLGFCGLWYRFSELFNIHLVFTTF